MHTEVKHDYLYWETTLFFYQCTAKRCQCETLSVSAQLLERVGILDLKKRKIRRRKDLTGNNVKMNGIHVREAHRHSPLRIYP
jgi:hypothetical protein